MVQRYIIINKKMEIKSCILIMKNNRGKKLWKVGRPMPQICQDKCSPPRGEQCPRLEKVLYDLGQPYYFLPCIITEGSQCLVMMRSRILKNIIMGCKCFLWKQNDHSCLRLCKYALILVNSNFNLKKQNP